MELAGVHPFDGSLPQGCASTSNGNLPPIVFLVHHHTVSRRLEQLEWLE
jgi:hypothetical protein